MSPTRGEPGRTPASGVVYGSLDRFDLPQEMARRPQQMSAAVARVFTSLLFLSAMAPFLLMAQAVGPGLGAAMREIKPLVVPQNRWEFAGMWGGFGAGTEISKIAGGAHGSALSGGVKPGGAAGGAQVAGGGLEEDARSFWSYGPLVIFAGGIVISILVKSLALPVGGAATEALYSLLRSQALQPGEGGVREGRGGAEKSSRGAYPEQVEVRVDDSPARGSSHGSSGGEGAGRRASGGSGGSGNRWPCKLDLLPESAPPSRLSGKSSGKSSPRGEEGGGDTDRSGGATEQRA